jgi:hypothetical protein
MDYSLMVFSQQDAVEMGIGYPAHLVTFALPHQQVHNYYPYAIADRV